MAKVRLPHRRQFLHLAAAGAALPSITSAVTLAQDYPSKPVRLIEPFGAGGGPDIALAASRTRSIRPRSREAVTDFVFQIGFKTDTTSSVAILSTGRRRSAAA